MPRPRKYESSEQAYLAQLEASRKWKERNREYTREYAKNLYRSKCTSFEGYCQHFLKRCNDYTKDHDVTLEFLLSLPRVCAITGKNFEYDNVYNTSSNPLAPSLDQIIPSNGYYKNNIQIVLNCINKMKGDMSDNEFRKLLKDMNFG